MDPSIVAVDNSSTHVKSLVPVPTEPEANSEGAVPKSNSRQTQTKKVGRFSGFRFGFGKLKKSIVPEIDSTSTFTEGSTNSKTDKKNEKKKNKEIKNQQVVSAQSDNSSSSFKSESSLRRLTSEVNFPTLKRQISKSTLIRKMSFGKKKIANRTRIYPDNSVSTSTIAVDSSHSATEADNRDFLDMDDETPGFLNDLSARFDTEESGDYLDAYLDDSVLKENKLTKYEIEGTKENHRDALVIVIQSEETAEVEGGSQSGASTLGSREGFNQSEHTIDIQPDNVNDVYGFYELEKDFQKPLKYYEVRSGYIAVSIDNVSSKFHDKTNSHFEVNESAIATAISLNHIPGVPSQSSTFVGQLQPGEPVGILEEAHITAVSHGQDKEEDVAHQTDARKTSFAEKTFKLRSAWMSEQINKEEETVDQKPKQQGFIKQNTSTKSQILSITTPMWEKQKLEEAAKEIVKVGDEILSVVPELSDVIDKEDPVTPTNVDMSVASSSKSDVYFTPRDSPSPSRMSQDDESSLTPESSFYSAELPVQEKEVVEEVIARTQPESSTMHDGDVMAEARAKLSQNLGISPTVATQVGDKREHLYKILVIGELGTGKTSIIKRYVHQFFSQHYRATIGVDFALKVLNWDANTIIRLQLWDIAGQERFGNMTRVYYKEAVGAFIVFDVTRAATFDAVVKWKQDLDSKVQLPDGSSIPCVLLANKCDQQKEGLVNNPGKMDEYCKERGFAGWYETSAKENINIEEAARSLVTKILQNDQLRIQSDSSRDGDKFNLDGHAQDDKKSKCAC